MSLILFVIWHLSLFGNHLLLLLICTNDYQLSDQCLSFHLCESLYYLYLFFKSFFEIVLICKVSLESDSCYCFQMLFLLWVLPNEIVYTIMAISQLSIVIYLLTELREISMIESSSQFLCMFMCLIEYKAAAHCVVSSYA